MTQEFPSVSELLEKIKLCEGDKISILQIVTLFAEGGFAFLLIVFAAPLALPLPAIGVAQVMAVPILLLAGQLALGRHMVWLPAKISAKEIKMRRMHHVIDVVIPYIKKIEYFLKPRLYGVTSLYGQRLIGIMCFICAISVALPFPFSNTIPSMGIVLMSIGLLERDGVAILMGAMVGVIGICFAAFVMYFGVEVVFAVIDQIKIWCGI